MAEHFTKNTVSVSAHCKACSKIAGYTKHTMHRVDGVKRGPCLECIERLSTEHAQREIDERRAGRQENLFRGVM